MKKKQTKAQKSNYQKYFPLVIFISILCMSVGYAIINSISLDISGEALAKNVEGVYITEVNYVSNNNADTSNSKIINAHGTLLNSDITLSSIDQTSSITYEIKLYNSNDYNCLFKETITDEDFYSNSNITYILSDSLVTDTVIKSKNYLTFTITFKYKEDVIPSSNINNLVSYIDFNFIREPYILASYSTPGTYSYTITEAGIYRFQLWGASGYGNTTTIGNGGYVQGDIELEENTTIYIYVGGKGQKLSSPTAGTDDGGGFNGGGNASNADYSYQSRYGGGGATDIRLSGGEWNDFESLKSRIMVAGGGGSYSQTAGGNSGGLNGYGDTGEYAGSGGTQTSGGLNKISTTYKNQATPGGFGYGGNGGSYSSGGGSGYYGGGGGMRAKTDGGGGGGSSFISGHEGCDAITETSTSDAITHTGQSIHYSGYYFVNTKMIDGAGYLWTTEKTTNIIGLPNYNGTGTMTSSVKDGYAIIKRVPTE